MSQESPQRGIQSAMIKNGNQHITKAPVIIASVLAAFLSLLASSVSRFSLLDGTCLSRLEGFSWIIGGCSLDKISTLLISLMWLWWLAEPLLVVVAVDDFSGETLLDTKGCFWPCTSGWGVLVGCNCCSWWWLVSEAAVVIVKAVVTSLDYFQ